MGNKKKLIFKTLTLASSTFLKTISKFHLTLVLTLALTSCSSALFENTLFKDASGLSSRRGRSPSSYGLNYSKIRIDSKIDSWFIPAIGQKNSNNTLTSKATVIFFHSKNGTPKKDFYRTLWLLNKSYNVLIPDHNSVEDIYSELDTIVNFVGKNEKLGKIILWGQDIGASMVIYLAANSFNKSNICLTIAEGTIPNYSETSKKETSKNFMLKPFSKVFSMVSSKLANSIYDAENFIENISPAPLLVIHGTEDKKVSTEEIKKLYAKARKPKELWLIKGASHLNSLYNQKLRQDQLGKYIDINCL